MPKTKPIPKEKKTRGSDARMIKVAENIVNQLGTTGKVNITQAARDAGYTEYTALNGGIHRRFKDFLRELIPEDEIIAKLKALTHAKVPKTFEFSLKVPNEMIEEMMESCGFQVISIKEVITSKYVSVAIPDARIQKDAVDMWLKVQGAYASDKNEEDKIKMMGELLAEQERKRTEERAGIEKQRESERKMIQGKILGITPLQ